jgi:hypothetical protein
MLAIFRDRRIPDYLPISRRRRAMSSSSFFATPAKTMKAPQDFPPNGTQVRITHLHFAQ